ncbi:hypothetical protein BOTBODRAFT_26546 [Botryobasidium botryosum FD-172 SS1]|uniref:NADP-dependent oxidoreductase domain-containing protein n=1 Tax=Botryobasidium botryosum (strain FD-172 SS1) TaxID=930990 RepID=A0A067MXN9_BOTB1|nr:hypothetical protein BOTBODRAFT_26546 [Botryobasidium botryosum FD-172 SS1]
MIGLDSPQPTYTAPAVDSVPDTEADRPVEGKPLTSEHCEYFSPLVFGAAALSHHYNPAGWLDTDGPLRTVRLALRYGITAFDTSPWYGASEIVLGSVLQSLSSEFPRSSYKLITKCGRYGPEVKDFDYSPGAIRRSVARSLERLKTDYLDVLFLHDVEFVATRVTPNSAAGDGSLALAGDGERAWGFVPGEEARVWGEGDQKILIALAEIRKMKEEGIVKAIGITGLPLPTLLRLSLLALHTPPYEPLDCILSYAQFHLQNSTFASFLPHFISRAKIPHILCASPLAMGLLTSSPPSWHPAPPALHEVARETIALAQDWPGGLPNLALGFGMRRQGPVMGNQGRSVPTVVGFSNLDEVHEALKVWREVSEDDKATSRARLDMEAAVQQRFIERGWKNWSWAQPAEKQDK